MIRSHQMAAVPGLTVSDVNFNFSCLVHNHGFCFLKVWCPTVYASSGHSVLLTFGLQDTLSHKVIKKMCNTAAGQQISMLCSDHGFVQSHLPVAVKQRQLLQQSNL